MPGRATAGGKTPPALPALGLRVAISTWAHAESLTGEVVEHWCALGEAHQFKVRYDLDKDEKWHEANEPWETAGEADDCDRGWALVNNVCSITLQPLTQPAKTSMCKHLARCTAV